MASILQSACQDSDNSKTDSEEPSTSNTRLIIPRPGNISDSEISISAIENNVQLLNTVVSTDNSGVGRYDLNLVKLELRESGLPTDSLLLITASGGNSSMLSGLVNDLAAVVTIDQLEASSAIFLAPTSTFVVDYMRETSELSVEGFSDVSTLLSLVDYPDVNGDNELTFIDVVIQDPEYNKSAFSASLDTTYMNYLQGSTALPLSGIISQVIAQYASPLDNTPFKVMTSNNEAAELMFEAASFEAEQEFNYHVKKVCSNAEIGFERFLEQNEIVIVSEGCHIEYAACWTQQLTDCQAGYDKLYFYDGAVKDQPKKEKHLEVQSRDLVEAVNKQNLYQLLKDNAVFSGKLEIITNKSALSDAEMNFQICQLIQEFRQSCDLLF
jgi:hypothetical protein